ncbi:MAG: Nudix family hydrolase [Gammaproteobacteria bacterium]
MAVGVLQRADGTVLVSERQADKNLAGYLEFPGGKIESGETSAVALRRELHEELGISTAEACLRPLIRFEHDYPEFRVSLCAYRIGAWEGEPVGREGQCLSWYTPKDLFEAPLLPANRPLLNALTLPSTLLITPRPEPGETDAFVQRFEQALAGEHPDGAILRLRDRTLLKLLEAPLAAVAYRRERPLILNSGEVTPCLPKGFSGLHLPASVLATLDARPAVDGWVGASVHTVEEAAHARRLGLDYVIAGNVRETPSHPGGKPLGWSGFEEIVAAAGIPAYAIGGMTPEDLFRVRLCWGQGVAAIHAFWKP